MDEIYKIASTERIQVLEKELATQLTELKSEIEEQWTLQGSARQVTRAFYVRELVGITDETQEILST